MNVSAPALLYSTVAKLHAGHFSSAKHDLHQFYYKQQSILSINQAVTQSTRIRIASLITKEVLNNVKCIKKRT